MTDKEVELYKKLTEALGRKVPECWPFVWLSGSIEDREVYAAYSVERGYFEPTLSQLLTLIEAKGFKQMCGNADLEGYTCVVSLRREVTAAEPNSMVCLANGVFEGNSIKEAVLKAAIVVVKETNK